MNYIYYIRPAFVLGQPFARPIFQMSKGFNVSFLIMCLHKSSQPIDEQNLAKHASGMIESTPCHHDLHGFTTEMLVWVCQTPYYIRPHPQEAGIASTWTFKTNSRIWHHPKIHPKHPPILTAPRLSLKFKYWNVCQVQDHQIGQLLCLQDSNWFNLTSQKHVPLTYPFLWLVKNFPTNFKPTRLHEFSRENTAHVQVLGVGFKGFVVAQDLCRAGRRHWRNQQGIAQTMLCLYPRWTAAASAGRDVGPKISRRNLRLKEKMPINFLWGDFFGGGCVGDDFLSQLKNQFKSCPLAAPSSSLGRKSHGVGCSLIFAWMLKSTKC